MSKLPVISSDDLIRYLSKKGFIHKHSKGSHHVYILDNIRIIIPQRKEIGKGLLLAILAEAKIKREDFIQDWNN